MSLQQAAAGAVLGWGSEQPSSGSDSGPGPATWGSGRGARAGPETAPLNVVALVSGGKDSFFSLLHCLANGHRVVALANLHPPSLAAADDNDDAAAVDEEADLNSFMYQTVGHQVIPLYGEATGLPLFRAAIKGGAVQSARDYYGDGGAAGNGAAGTSPDETESMTTLLQTVLAAHPGVDAVCAGAILSTYQRTRVESVAVRLGLAPLAYLWKFPVLPLPSSAESRRRGEEEDDDGGAQLLRDMAAAGLEARLIKVASGGLDESFLWEDVTSASSVARLRHAMARFGTLADGGGSRSGGGGAVLGEGGEFETLVVDGPRCLFRRGRVVVGDGNDDRAVMREGGGTSWLRIKKATFETRPGEADLEVPPASSLVRVPDLLDNRFTAVLGRLASLPAEETAASEGGGRRCGADLHEDLHEDDSLPQGLQQVSSRLEQWTFAGAPATPSSLSSIVDETHDVVGQIRRRLADRSLDAAAIVSAVVVLRRMSDFPVVNAIYGALFAAPNPPSRVTVSAGDRLGRGISVSLTVHNGGGSSGRQGLHVQSRSYWAPANIGPYSQAISVPISRGLVAAPNCPASPTPPPAKAEEDDDDDDDDSQPQQLSSMCPRLVFVAGQIPLVPATMNLPPHPPIHTSGPATSRFALQATLALQHLWRIGAELRVRWWSGVVAYIPHSDGGDDHDARDKARVASRVWAEAHRLSASGAPYRPPADGDEDDEDEVDEGGPDLWDRRHNPAVANYGRGPGGIDGRGRPAAPSLPDWDVVGAEQAPRPPPFFLAEVEELPRGAGVEWHAHVGFSDVASGGVRCRFVSNRKAAASAAGPSLANGAASSHRTTVDGDDGVSFVHTATAVDAASYSSSFLSSPALRQDGGPSSWYLCYIDSGLVSQSSLADAGVASTAVLIPCGSLWDASGERLALVGLARETRVAAPATRGRR